MPAQRQGRARCRAGAAQTLDDEAIITRIEARATAKRARDFAAADVIRAELAAQGIELKDSARGTTWVRA